MSRYFQVLETLHIASVGNDVLPTCAATSFASLIKALFMRPSILGVVRQSCHRTIYYRFLLKEKRHLVSTIVTEVYLLDRLTVVLLVAGGPALASLSRISSNSIFLVVLANSSKN